MNKDNGIIGGMFGLEDISICHKHRSPPLFLEKNCLEMINGRSCLQLLVSHLSPKRIWLPSYLCESIFQAFSSQTVHLCFYEVNYNLEIENENWLEDLGDGDLVVIIDYFGFPADPYCALEARDRGAWVLEDASQALLTEDIGRNADFTLFSPRKWLHIADGGILTHRDDSNMEEITLQTPPAHWCLRSLEASIQRREFERNGRDNGWFDLYQEVEESQPLGLYAMTELSRNLLRYGFEYDVIIKKRRENYFKLLEQFREVALFKDLPSTVVPLGFPVRLENRHAIQQALFREKIYPPIHWQLPAAVPPKHTSSYKLADNILTLPCDQRYGANHMDRLEKCFQQALNEQKEVLA